MPPPPEFSNAPGKIGGFKIFGQPDAEHLGHAQGDVHIAGEIGVQLHRVAQHRQGHIQPLVILPVVKHRVCQHRSPFRHHHLFEKAPQDPLDAVHHIVIVKAVGLKQLGSQVRIFSDGALEDLGKIHNIQGILERILLRLADTPVHIDTVADGLEGIEGDSQWQHKGNRCSPGKDPQQKAAILHHRQNPQGDCHRQGADQGFDPAVPGADSLPLLPGQPL